MYSVHGVGAVGVLMYLTLGPLVPRATADECLTWRDCAPIINVSQDWVDTGPMMMTSVLPSPPFSTGYVEHNWENATGGEALHVTVHEAYSTHTEFVSPINPDGRLRVIEYHFYYPKNDHTLMFKHEHDWEWIYVALAPMETTSGGVGWGPVAVTVSGHDDENYESDLRLWDDVERDGWRPIVYQALGNAFSFEPIPMTNYQYVVDIDGAGDGQGHTISYATCESVWNHDIAYGITGETECNDMRSPPWLRSHWDRPLQSEQFQTPPWPSYDNDFAAECACAIAGSWSRLKQCFFDSNGGHRMQEFSSSPRAGLRAEGIFTNSDGTDRLVWRHWAPELDSYSVVSATDNGTSDSGVAAESSLVAPRSSFSTVTYSVAGYAESVERRHTKHAQSKFMGLAANDVPTMYEVLTTASAVPGGDATYLLGVSDDGVLVIYDVADLSEPVEYGAYDLRDYGLYEYWSNFPNDMEVAWVTLGEEPHQVERQVLTVSCPGRGTGVFDITDISTPVFVVRLSASQGNDACILDDGAMVTAGGSEGAKVHMLGFGGSLSYSFLGSFSSGLLGEDVLRVGKLGPNRVLVSTRYESLDPDLWYAAKSHVWSVPQGVPTLLSEVVRPASEWPMIDPLWDIDDLDEDQGIAMLSSANYMDTMGVAELTSDGVVVVEAFENPLFLRSQGHVNRAVILPDRHIARAGRGQVAYGGTSFYDWGGVEIWQDRPFETDAHRTRFVSCLADDGWNSATEPNWAYRGLARIPRSSGDALIVSYRNSVSPTECRLATYVVAEDIATVDVPIDGDPAVRPWSILAFGPVRGSNPVRESGWEFEIVVSEATQLKVEAFDVSGRRVRAFDDRVVLPGSYSYVWDRRSDHGKIVPSGVYWIRASAGKDAISRRVVVVR